MQDAQPNPAATPPDRVPWSDDPVGRLAVWTDARLPAPQMLRAMAEEYGGRSARALRKMADRVESGESLQQAFAQTRQWFPRRMRGQLESVATTNNLRLSLAALAACRESSLRVAHSALATLAYPLLVLATIWAVAVLFAVMVMPAFRSIFEDFQLELPVFTQVVLSVAVWAPAFGALVVGGLVVVLLLSTIPRVSAWVHWFVRGLPLVGRVWQCQGHHRLSQLMTAYTAAGLSAADALAATAAGLHDQSLAHSTRRAGRLCREGQSMGQALSDSRSFERSLTTLVRWGERNNAAPEAFAEAARSYQLQSEQLLMLLRRTAPPLVLVAATLFVVIVMMALLLPLFSLITGLT